MDKDDYLKTNYDTLVKKYEHSYRERMGKVYNSKINGMKADWLIIDECVEAEKDAYIIGNKKINEYLVIDNNGPHLTDNMEFVTKFTSKNNAEKELNKFEGLGYYIDDLSVIKL